MDNREKKLENVNGGVIVSGDLVFRSGQDTTFSDLVQRGGGDSIVSTLEVKPKTAAGKKEEALRKPGSTALRKMDFSWSYEFPVKERRYLLSSLKTMGTVLAFTLLIIAACLAASSPPGMILETFRSCSFVFHMITAIYVFSFILTYFLYKGVFCYSYECDGESLIMKSYAPPGSPADLADGTVKIAQSNEIHLSSIKKLIRKRKLNAIDIRGFLIVTTVYASDSDYEKVFSYLAARCANAEII